MRLGDYISGLPEEDKPKPDDVADFILKFQPDQRTSLYPKKIKAKGKVKRIGQSTKEFSDFGIALGFLSGAVFVYGD